MWLRNQSQTLFKKIKLGTYLEINNLKFDTVCFYYMPKYQNIPEFSKIKNLKFGEVCFYCIFKLRSTKMY